ncbi:hypothetical protein SeMB42_g00856 [Synchytrium endobioticum]|uniref:Uncharacterized protein n=1 Tax=Synchytrium endobioticum TaxID=286115 RepID=A0A507DNW9_9FUNG|nr:hypothetical protein SeLEV6574_g00137 [Synchytrium endobioticum]TPX53293.1 hypothetical protein SeMB42_g00856 [Synchytrium endobioticum]
MSSILKVTIILASLMVFVLPTPPPEVAAGTLPSYPPFIDKELLSDLESWIEFNEYIQVILEQLKFWISGIETSYDQMAHYDDVEQTISDLDIFLRAECKRLPWENYPDITDFQILPQSDKFMEYYPTAKATFIEYLELIGHWHVLFEYFKWFEKLAVSDTVGWEQLLPQHYFLEQYDHYVRHSRQSLKENLNIVTVTGHSCDALDAISEIRKILSIERRKLPAEVYPNETEFIFDFSHYNLNYEEIKKNFEEYKKLRQECNILLEMNQDVCDEQLSVPPASRKLRRAPAFRHRSDSTVRGTESSRMPAGSINQSPSPSLINSFDTRLSLRETGLAHPRIEHHRSEGRSLKRNAETRQ